MSKKVLSPEQFRALFLSLSEEEKEQVVGAMKAFSGQQTLERCSTPAPSGVPLESRKDE